MDHGFNYRDVLASSARAAWQAEDVLPDDAKLDFRRRFLPEALARTDGIAFMSEPERRVLNQIRGHEYLSLFGLIEEFILPFVLDHVRPTHDDDHLRVRAMLRFAAEEAKHLDLFRRFHRRFVEGFGTPCESIGPARVIAAEVLSHDPLSVALFILHVEWMTQSHYLDSVRDDGDIDPLFKSLLKHHWMEEEQHAKVGTLIVEGLAEGRDEAAIEEAVDGYFEISAFMDAGLVKQTHLNLDAFERAFDGALSAERRRELQVRQHQALRWTYLGSGMVHPRFMATMAALSPAARDRIAAAAPAFA